MTFAYAEVSAVDALTGASGTPKTQASVSVLTGNTTPADENSPEYKAAVEKLRALIVQLTTTLTNLLAERAKATITNENTAQKPECDSIVRTLAVGSRGNDVLCLQKFLITKGHLTADLTTGFYGPLTAAAVQQYQRENNLVSLGTVSLTEYGAVGSRTQQAINQALADLTITSTTSPAGTGRRFRAATDEGASQSGCVLDGITLASGVTGYFYNSQIVANGQTCSSVPRTCINGTLSGSTAHQYAHCAVQAAVTTLANCTFNGQSIASGQSITTYQSLEVATGAQCASEQRSCSNGTLSGTYLNSTCSVQSATSCSWNGQTISSGQSVTAYQSSSVAYGSQCVSEQRTCNSGTLSGSNVFGSCVVAAVPVAASCTLDGVTLQDGQSATYYTATSVTYGSSCASIGVSRSCSNGTLNGSATNNKATCFVAAATPAAPICSFTGRYGDGAGSAFLSWTTSNATAVSIDHNIGSVNLQSIGYGGGEYALAYPFWTNPEATYTMTVTGAGGNTQCSAYVSVGCVDPEPNAQFGIPEGATVTRYDTSKVLIGDSCNSHAQARTCSHRALSGNAGYMYLSCALGGGGGS